MTRFAWRPRGKHLPESQGCLLHPSGASRRWLALSLPRTRLLVNETEVSVGLRQLRHRDALGIAGGAAVYFSTEESARVETFEATAQSVICPRCRDEIAAGQMVVRCPTCGVVHHELADGRNCWSYASTCAAACGQPTALDNPLRWTPETL